MGVLISGDNVTVPGQVTVQTAPTSTDHAVRRSDVHGLRATETDLDLQQATPTDVVAVTLASTKCLIKRVTFVNATADLSAAVVDIRTASGGGGDAIVAAETLTNLSAADTAHICTVDLPNTPVTTGELYVRLTTTAGSDGTADIIIEYEDFADL